MRKIDFWCLKHKLLAFILLTLSLNVCGGIVLYALSAPIWALVAYSALIFLLNILYVNFSYAKGVQVAIENFNNCDPYPLYELSEKILPYVKGTSGQDILLNKTSSLFWMGEHEKMLEILEELNIDKISGTLLQSKIVYYNNLTCAYESLGRIEDAAKTFKKVKQLCEDANPKIKEQYKNIMISAEIFELKSEGRYEEALKLTQDCLEKDLLQKISVAMERAELFIAMKDYEKAKTQLKFISLNGYRTHFVKKAQEMYNKIADL